MENRIEPVYGLSLSASGAIANSMGVDNDLTFFFIFRNQSYLGTLAPAVAGRLQIINHVDCMLSVC